MGGVEGLQLKELRVNGDGQAVRSSSTVQTDQQETFDWGSLKTILTSFSTRWLGSEQTDHCYASIRDHSQNAQAIQGVLICSAARTNVCFQGGYMLFVDYSC